MPTQPGSCPRVTPSRPRRRAVGTRAGRRARAPAHARRTALTRARPFRLQVALLRRPAGPRRRVSPGHGVGVAHRPVRRRMAARASQRPRERAALARGLCRASQRGGRRLDQRDLRRRAAVHAARVRGAGVERRGGAARVAGQRRRRRARVVSAARYCGRGRALASAIIRSTRARSSPAGATFTNRSQERMAPAVSFFVS